MRLLGHASTAGSGCCSSRSRRRPCGCTPPPGRPAAAAGAALADRSRTAPARSGCACRGTAGRAVRTSPHPAPSARTGSPGPRSAPRAPARRASSRRRRCPRRSCPCAVSLVKHRWQISGAVVVDGPCTSLRPGTPSGPAADAAAADTAPASPDPIRPRPAVPGPAPPARRAAAPRRATPSKHMRELAGFLLDRRSSWSAPRRSPARPGLLAGAGHRVHGGPQPGRSPDAHKPARRTTEACPSRSATTSMPAPASATLLP